MTIKTRATVGADGMVHVNLRVGEAHAGEEVEVVVARPGELAGSGSSIQYPPGWHEMSQEEHVRRVEKLAGCINDPTFEVPDDMPPQERDWLE